MVRTMACTLILAAAFLASACKGGTDEGAAEVKALRAAETAWAKSGIDDYQYVLSISRFCCNGGTYDVTVRDGVVQSATKRPSTEPLSAEEASRLPTVIGLFDVLEDAYDRKAEKVTASYDSSLGFPTSIFIDYDVRVADEEIGYAVSELH